jgi:calcyclin binding protein
MEWDGKVKPRLLEKQDRDPDFNQEAVVKLLKSSEITQYGWEDQPKRVKIYITLKGVGALADDQIVLTWEEQKLILRVNDLDGKNWGLTLNLYDTIKGAKLKKKPDSVVLTLSKADERTWAELKCSSD